MVISLTFIVLYMLWLEVFLYPAHIVFINKILQIDVFKFKYKIYNKDSDIFWIYKLIHFLF